MKPATAYIVTEGEYSAYTILRVYLTKADAEAYALARNDGEQLDRWSSVRVEEWPIGDAGYVEDIVVWDAIWDGRIEDGTRFGREPIELKQRGYEGPKLPRAEVYAVDAEIPWVHVRGTSKEHVEKALHDTVAQVKAERAGIA